LQMPGSARAVEGEARFTGTRKLATSMSTASSPNILGYLIFIVPTETLNRP